MSTIWLLLLIPTIIAFLVQRYFKKELFWNDYLFLFIIPFLVIALFQRYFNAIKIEKNEYVANKIINVNHYEMWNEKVNCSHEIRCVHANYNGLYLHENDGYEHLYDILWHPEYFEATTADRKIIEITRQEYNKIVSRFQNEKYISGTSNFYTKSDGTYTSVWNYQNSTIFPIVTLKTIYEYKSDKKNEKEIKVKKTNDLYDYPLIIQNNCKVILSNYWNNQLDSADILLKKYIVNQNLKSEVFFWILIFKDKKSDIADLQAKYWDNGRNNEFIVMIGIDSLQKIQWTKIVSKTSRKDLISRSGFFIENMGYFDPIKVVTYLGKEIGPAFIRFELNSFDFLNAKPSIFSIILATIIIGLSNLLALYWSIKDDY